MGIEDCVVDVDELIGEWKQTALVPKHPDDPECTDFVMSEGGPGVWIEAGTLSVWVRANDEGVVVEIYPNGHEADHDAVASTWATFAEGEVDEEEEDPCKTTSPNS